MRGALGIHAILRSTKLQPARAVREVGPMRGREEGRGDARGPAEVCQERLPGRAQAAEITQCIRGR